MLRKNFPGRKYQRRMRVIEELEKIPLTKMNDIQRWTLYQRTNMSFEQALGIRTAKSGGKAGRISRPDIS